MTVEFDELSAFVLNALKARLETNRGLAIFARERARFEAWMKVEVCASLSERFPDVVPEKDDIDITFEDWAVELKSVNTNYKYPNVTPKSKNITDTIQSVVDDMGRLERKGPKNQAVLFIAYPVEHDHPAWQSELNRVLVMLTELRHESFSFLGEIPGVIYIGLA